MDIRAPPDEPRIEPYGGTWGADLTFIEVSSLTEAHLRATNLELSILPVIRILHGLARSTIIVHDWTKANHHPVHRQEGFFS